MKTTYEKSIEYAEINDDKYCNVSKNFDKFDIAQSFEAGVEFAQRWISVEDELPKEGISVLIKNDFGYFGINVLENGIWRMCTVEKIAGLLNLKEYELENFATPTHWRPIELK